MDRRQRQKRRDSHAFPLHEPVGNHDNRVARAHRILGLCAKRREARLDRLLAPRQGVGDVQLERAELAAGVALDVPDFLHFEEVEHRLRYLEPERRFISSMPSKFGFGPMKDTRDVTSSSRIGVDAEGS